MTDKVKTTEVAPRSAKPKTTKPKAPKVELTPEQKAAKKAEREQARLEEERLNRLSRSLDDLRKSFIPVPPEHRTFEVGARAIFGAHPNAVISEVYDEGKYYLIRTFGTYSEYGHPVERTGEHVVSWLSLQPYREVEADNNISTVVIDGEDIWMSASQRDISGILSLYYHAGLDTEPDYQRALCWDADDNLAYIESVFEGRDLGKFVVVRLDYTGKFCYELLDGKQRLNALRMFYEDRLYYRGKLFSQLSWSDQNRFEATAVAFAEMSRVTRAQKLKVFLKVNIGGRPQDPAWLRRVESMLKHEERETTTGKTAVTSKK